MRLTSRTSPSSGRPDEGAALIITMMVMVLVGAVATSVAVLAIRNVQSSNMASSAGVAVDAANAGIAQGVSYLRANGVRAVEKCPTPTSADPSSAGFAAFDLGSGSCVSGIDDPDVRQVDGRPYTVLIAHPEDPADTADYLIVTRGYSELRAARVVTADVDAQGSGLAVGALQANTFATNGNVTIDGQSIFAKGCVSDRKHITFHGTDAYGLPPAVRSESTIGENNGCTSKLIHPPACNGAYPFDQDVKGGPLPTGSPCRPTGSGEYYAKGSLLEPGDLERLYGIRFPPLADEDIERLRATAIAQGNLRTDTNDEDAFTPHGQHAVVFYDMTNDHEVDPSNIQGFGYDGTCPDRSLVIVVKGASVRWTRNNVAPIVASVYVVTPGMEWYNTGGGLAGSVYSDSIVVGGASSYPDPAAAQSCANDSQSPLTMTFTVTSYRELDD